MHKWSYFNTYSTSDTKLFDIEIDQFDADMNFLIPIQSSVSIISKSQLKGGWFKFVKALRSATQKKFRQYNEDWYRTIFKRWV